MYVYIGREKVRRIRDARIEHVQYAMCIRHVDATVMQIVTMSQVVEETGERALM